MRAEHNGLAVHRLNHSATSSSSVNKVVELEKKHVLLKFRRVIDRGRKRLSLKQTQFSLEQPLL